MFANRIKELIHKSTRYHRLVVAFVLVALFGLVLVSQNLGTKTPESTTDELISASAIEVSGPILEASSPIRLRIPKINIDAQFESPLGVMASREVQVPDAYDTVGYYKYGPTPGELGPAVILGHVDSVDGPAVFFSLGQLEEGDEIEVDREDGTTATFVVTRLERHLQEGFPTAEVYGNIDHAGLRLITCSGVFNKGIQRYSHNLIVFAELKEG